jgi:NADH:ubiquinone oxidoreductase subunit E
MSIAEKIELPADVVEYIDLCLKKEHPESYLIAVLHKLQQRFGYLKREHLDEVAQRMQVPTAFVSGVATFYHFFRLKPQGRHQISVCLGTACFVKGADKILEAFQTELGIGLAEVTSDGLFSLDLTRCLGVCGLAPVVTINNKVYSQVTPQQVPELLNKVKAEDASKTEGTPAA